MTGLKAALKKQSRSNRDQHLKNEGKIDQATGKVKKAVERVLDKSERCGGYASPPRIAARWLNPRFFNTRRSDIEVFSHWFIDANEMVSAEVLERLTISMKVSFGEVVYRMRYNQLLNPSNTVKRLSLLAGYVAGESYSIYAIFVAHTMRPVTFRLVENNPDLRAIYGRYQEIFHWDGLLFTLSASFVVFALAWCAVRGIAEANLTKQILDSSH